MNFIVCHCCFGGGIVLVVVVVVVLMMMAPMHVTQVVRSNSALNSNLDTCPIWLDRFENLLALVANFAHRSSKTCPVPIDQLSRSAISDPAHE